MATRHEVIESMLSSIRVATRLGDERAMRTTLDKGFTHWALVVGEAMGLELWDEAWRRFAAAAEAEG